LVAGRGIIAHVLVSKERNVLSLEISRWLRLIGLAQLSSSAAASLAPRRMAMRTWAQNWRSPHPF
jgi:hypothetical protein